MKKKKLFFRFGRHYIYFVLDWSQPENAIVTVLGTLILAICVHTTLFLVCKLRFYIHEKCSKKKMILPTTQQSNMSNAQISMVLGSGYSNEAFSTDKI